MQVDLLGGDYAAIASGSSGGFDTNYFYVEKGQVYSITVGNGGKGVEKYSDQNPSSYSVGNGASGFVLIAYGGDI